MNRSLERQRNILDVALSSLARRRGKNTMLLAVYTLVVFLGASVIFLCDSLKEEARSLLDGAPDLVVQRLMAGRHDLIPVAYAEEMRKIRGVAEVTPRFWGYYFDPAIGVNYTVVAAQDPPRAGEVDVGGGISRARSLFEGDILPLRNYRGNFVVLTVRRVLPAESELVSADLVLVGEGDFRALFTLPPDRATDVAVRVSNPREIPTVARKIAKSLPDTRVIQKSEMISTYDSIFDWRGGLLILILCVVFLAFAIFAWDRATGLSAEERREIGILKGIGWETSDVLLLKLWEGCAVSLSAFLVGTALAFCHVFFFSGSLFAPVLKGWAVLYPHFQLTPRVSVLQLAVLFALSVVPYTAASIVPTWRAATVDPDAVMRGGA